MDLRESIQNLSISYSNLNINYGSFNLNASQSVTNSSQPIQTQPVEFWNSAFQEIQTKYKLIFFIKD